MTPPPAARRRAHDVAAALTTHRPGAVVGVYLHGSAVLGGFRPGLSDMDVLAVVAGPAGAAAQRRMGEAIAATGAGLEVSVVTAATARAPGEGRFEVHVTTTGDVPVIVAGAEAAGDPDLVLHVAVCRAHGVAVLGPPPARVFGSPPGRVRAAMHWSPGTGRPAYAVLNACRALRFAEERSLCSKDDGAAWYLARHPGDPAVTAALAHRRLGSPGPTPAAATSFVTSIRHRLPAS
jgi:streptomycin 3"-adenylyltransferase